MDGFNPTIRPPRRSWTLRGWDSRNLYKPIRKHVCARAGINDKYRLVPRNPRFH
jgi:hypothetical protein